MINNLMFLTISHGKGEKTEFSKTDFLLKADKSVSVLISQAEYFTVILLSLMKQHNIKITK